MARDPTDAHTTPSARMPSCPLCRGSNTVLAFRKAEIADQLTERRRFFRARLPEPLRCGELRDLTDVLLGTPAEIRTCDPCGVLLREDAPGARGFAEDRYPAPTLELLHETHVAAFREKEADYRPLLGSGARVLEIGSYAGGFLRAAREWGWDALGLDPGRDVASFTRELGLATVTTPPLSIRRHFDAVFIWNCFEQLQKPAGALKYVTRALRPGGWVVIRIPDASSYLRWTAERKRELLGYNCLLGWPHRFGFDQEQVRLLAERYGLSMIRTLRRPAIRPHRQDLLPWAREEEDALIHAGDRAANCGWIEMTFRGP